MSSAPLSYFSQRIGECRAAFARRNRGLLRWLGLKSEPNVRFDRGQEQLQLHYEILAKQGCVVWGTIAQANLRMFEAGHQDLPGVTVYSTDPYFDANPQDLMAIGHACMLFKNTDPVDPDFQSIAVRLTDEFDATLRMPLPARLADRRDVFLGATVLHRNRLPEGVLRTGLFPLVIAPDATEVNMLLPLPYWSEKLCKEWGGLRQRLQEMEITTQAPLVARVAEKKSARQYSDEWDMNSTPVLVTDAMAAAFAAISLELNHDGPLFLSVGLHEDGSKFAKFAPECDRLVEETFKSNGVSVVIRKGQRNKICGAIVDYKDSPFAKGVVIRLPGE